MTNPISLYYLVLRGPFGEMQVQPKIYHFEFSESTFESPLVQFPLVDSAECNKVLSGKMISCRFVFVRPICAIGQQTNVHYHAVFLSPTGWSCSCVLSKRVVCCHCIEDGIAWRSHTGVREMRIFAIFQLASQQVAFHGDVTTGVQRWFRRSADGVYLRTRSFSVISWTRIFVIGQFAFFVSFLIYGHSPSCQMLTFNSYEQCQSAFGTSFYQFFGNTRSALTFILAELFCFSFSQTFISQRV